jgi:protein SDA1
MLDTISRAIALHNLQFLQFYPYLIKYLEPSQINITKLLAVTAQSIHDLVPPESVSPILYTIANNFINDRSSPEGTIIYIK